MVDLTLQQVRAHARDLKLIQKLTSNSCMRKLELKGNMLESRQRSHTISTNRPLNQYS